MSYKKIKNGSIFPVRLNENSTWIYLIYVIFHVSYSILDTALLQIWRALNFYTSTYQTEFLKFRGSFLELFSKKATLKNLQHFTRKHDSLVEHLWKPDSEEKERKGKKREEKKNYPYVIIDRMKKNPQLFNLKRIKHMTILSMTWKTWIKCSIFECHLEINALLTTHKVVFISFKNYLLS